MVVSQTHWDHNNRLSSYSFGGGNESNNYIDVGTMQTIREIISLFRIGSLYRFYCLMNPTYGFDEGNKLAISLCEQVGEDLVDYSSTKPTHETVFMYLGSVWTRTPRTITNNRTIYHKVLVNDKTFLIDERIMYQYGIVVEKISK